MKREAEGDGRRKARGGRQEGGIVKSAVPPSRDCCSVYPSSRTVVGSLVAHVRKGSDLVNDPSVRRESHVEGEM